MKSYLSLTKSGIVFFVLLVSSAAYFISLKSFSDFSFARFSIFLLGLYLVSSGSFILNQVQERKIDSKMKRTARRPLPARKISVFQATSLALVFISLGIGMLTYLQTITGFLAGLTVIFYNGFYTLYWKKFYYHGAVLGALPGALPVVIGSSFAEPYLLTSECVYLFLLMFLWQMPHFWILAIRYSEDYKGGGIPVLPLPEAYGLKKTIHEMRFYLLAYIGLVLISPLFLRVGLMYLLLVLPVGFKVLYEFKKYIKDTQKWLRFFLWVNASIIVYLSVPIFDKWFFHYLILS